VGNQFAEATAPIVTTAQDGEAYYRYMKDKGLDLGVCEGWQYRYADMLDGVFSIKGKRILDLGAAMGALTWPMRQAGADAWGIEINPYLVRETPIKEIRGYLLLGDLVDVMRQFKVGSFDLVHASQTLEHIAPERQPDIFGEIARILRLGGFLFAAMPMRDPPPEGVADYEDPTHLCIRPKVWWEQFQRLGFRDAPIEYEAMLEITTMFQEYRWTHLLWEAA